MQQLKQMHSNSRPLSCFIAFVKRPQDKKSTGFYYFCNKTLRILQNQTMLTFENDFPLKRTIHTFDLDDLVKSKMFL